MPRRPGKQLRPALLLALLAAPAWAAPLPSSPSNERTVIGSAVEGLPVSILAPSACHWGDWSFCWWRSTPPAAAAPSSRAPASATADVPNVKHIIPMGCHWIGQWFCPRRHGLTLVPGDSDSMGSDSDSLSAAVPDVAASDDGSGSPFQLAQQQQLEPELEQDQQPLHPASPTFQVDLPELVEMRVEHAPRGPDQTLLPFVMTDHALLSSSTRTSSGEGGSTDGDGSSPRAHPGMPVASPIAAAAAAAAAAAREQLDAAAARAGHGKAKPEGQEELAMPRILPPNPVRGTMRPAVHPMPSAVGRVGSSTIYTVRRSAYPPMPRPEEEEEEDGWEEEPIFDMIDV